VKLANEFFYGIAIEAGGPDNKGCFEGFPPTGMDRDTWTPQ